MLNTNSTGKYYVARKANNYTMASAPDCALCCEEACNPGCPKQICQTCHDYFPILAGCNDCNMTIEIDEMYDPCLQGTRRSSIDSDDSRLFNLLESVSDSWQAESPALTGIQASVCKQGLACRDLNCANPVCRIWQSATRHMGFIVGSSSPCSSSSSNLSYMEPEFDSYRRWLARDTPVKCRRLSY